MVHLVQVPLQVRAVLGFLGSLVPRERRTLRVLLDLLWVQHRRGSLLVPGVRRVRPPHGVRVVLGVRRVLPGPLSRWVLTVLAHHEDLGHHVVPEVQCFLFHLRYTHYVYVTLCSFSGTQDQENLFKPIIKVASTYCTRSFLTGCTLGSCGASGSLSPGEASASDGSLSTLFALFSCRGKIIGYTIAKTSLTY